MAKAKFKVFGDFDHAREATVTIDRGADLFSVRPHRRHREYTLPLAEVARIVLWRIVKAEAETKAREKKLVRRKR